MTGMTVSKEANRKLLEGEEQMIDLVSMRRGLVSGEFFLEYLPTVALADGRCMGAEALVRWSRPTGVVSPDEFMPIAENCSFSGQVCYWVIETVAAELRDWLRATPDASISINIPPEILGRGGVQYASDRCGLTELASQVILEITERGVPDLIGIKALTEAPELGVRVALDDVTLVGGANLAILARCHFSMIKLDKSLIAQIDPQSPTPVWLEGIAALIQSSQLMVIAEGVETAHQALTVRAAGIQAAQGFYFSPPLLAPAFIAYYHEQRTIWPNPALQQASAPYVDSKR
jgi:sensor c-di-GMP phosphodiesterase-like protein